LYINQQLFTQTARTGNASHAARPPFFSVDVTRGKELRYSTPLVAVNGISVDVPAPGMQQRPASSPMPGHWVPSGKDPTLQQYSQPLPGYGRVIVAQQVRRLHHCTFFTVERRRFRMEISRAELLKM